VADALCFVAQTYTLLGHRDPRWTPGSNTIDVRIARQLKGYTRSDAPPSRVKPIPLPVLRAATTMALVDMLWIAFFFLLCPGEYTCPSQYSHLFRFSDVQLWHGSAALCLSSCSDQDLSAATFVSLTFSTQKNGTRGEAIGHGLSGNPVACPVLSGSRRIQYLRNLTTDHSVYLCAVGPTLAPLLPIQLTKLLRTAVLSTNNTSGLIPSDITAKSLSSTGAMALLNCNVSFEKLRLIGHWKSDAALRYLHVQAHDIMADCFALMLDGSDYRIIPSTTFPCYDPFLFLWAWALFALRS
jgi:hypothetical protein